MDQPDAFSESYDEEEGEEEEEEICIFFYNILRKTFSNKLSDVLSQGRREMVRGARFKMFSRPHATCSDPGTPSGRPDCPSPLPLANKARAVSAACHNFVVSDTILTF